MGLDNPLHIAIVLIVVLLVFGAKRLPELGKSMGEGLRGFKESVNGDSHAQPSQVEESSPSDPRPVDQPETHVSHVSHADADADASAEVQSMPVPATVEPLPVPAAAERTPVPAAA
jgi:sec-independent protein translocase protein TatA